MKRLLVLTLLAMFAASATGCGWWQPWWRRGAQCDPCGSTAAYNPGGSGYEMAYPPAVGGAPHLLPGPVTVPGPG